MGKQGASTSGQRIAGLVALPKRREKVLNNKDARESFTTCRDALFKACGKGYAHLLIAKKIKSDYIQGYLAFKRSPTFWFYSYGAHSECVFSYLARIVEKRKNPNPKNITIFKYLNIVGQNIEFLFEENKQEDIKKAIEADYLLLEDKKEIINKLKDLRDKFLFHLDKQAFLNKSFFPTNEINDTDIERLYLLIEEILNRYSVFFDETKMPYDLSSLKITFDMDFKAFEE